MTDTVEEIEQRLAERADEPLPESWKPDRPGQRIVGRVRRYEKGTTGWGDCVICVVESLRRPGQLASVWLFGTVLVNAFRKQRPKRGEVILVEYRGMVHPDGGGADYKDWRLVVDRPDGAEGLDFAEAFGETPAPAPVAGAHVTYEPPVDWQTTGNADDRAGFNDNAASVDLDDIPF
jgi:hypothetical protein